MAKGDQELKFDVPQYLKYLLNLSAETYEAMWEAAEERESGLGPVDEWQETFNELLKRLYFAYEPKFSYTKMVELPESLEDVEAWEIEDQLDFEEKMKLVRKIRDLQEAIGHTKHTHHKHQDKGVGPDVKKKG